MELKIEIWDLQAEKRAKDRKQKLSGNPLATSLYGWDYAILKVKKRQGVGGHGGCRPQLPPCELGLISTYLLSGHNHRGYVRLFLSFLTRVPRVCLWNIVTAVITTPMTVYENTPQERLSQREMLRRGAWCLCLPVYDNILLLPYSVNPVTSLVFKWGIPVWGEM